MYSVYHGLRGTTESEHGTPEEALAACAEMNKAEQGSGHYYRTDVYAKVCEEIIAEGSKMIADAGLFCDQAETVGGDWGVDFVVTRESDDGSESLSVYVQVLKPQRDCRDYKAWVANPESSSGGNWRAKLLSAIAELKS